MDAIKSALTGELRGSSKDCSKSVLMHDKEELKSGLESRVITSKGTTCKSLLSFEIKLL